MLPPPSAFSLIDPKILKKSIRALLKRNQKEDSKKETLLEERKDDELFLILSLSSALGGRGDPLPKPLFLPHGIEVSKRICIIVKDNLNLSSSKGLIKILPIGKLRSEYKPFEAKRRLLAEFDLFLADKRIVPLLPQLLGKKFFEKKKLPIPIDVKENLLQNMTKWTTTAVTPLYIPKNGQCVSIRFGSLSELNPDQLMENCVSAIEQVSKALPRRKMLFSAHIKTLNSAALPLQTADALNN